MLMFLSAKRLAFLGLLLACAILLIVLSGIIETNSLFLLAGASFAVGIALRESGLRYGLGFYIAAVLLAFLLAPNKLYCITFSAMGFYLVCTEFVWQKLESANKIQNRKTVFWILKYGIFNIIYLPILLFFPNIVYPGNINSVFLIILFAAGQVALFLYDMAYNYFQKSIWNKVRGRINF